MSVVRFICTVMKQYMSCKANLNCRDIDFGELLSPEMRAAHKHTTYDLAANIVHDSEPGGGQGGTYRCHVLHKVLQTLCGHVQCVICLM